MYINYDFQVKLPTNNLLKRLTEQDFAEFYNNSIAIRMKVSNPLLSVWLSSSWVKAIKKKFISITFYADSLDVEPVARFNMFECTEFNQLRERYNDEKTYQISIKTLNNDWQNFLANKLGAEYISLLDAYNLALLDEKNNASIS